MTLFVWELVGAATLVLVLLFAGAKWARDRRPLIEQGRLDLQQFTQASVSLINDRAIPSAIADFVARNASDATKPHMARWFAARIKDGSLFRDRAAEPVTELGRQFYHAMQELDESQQQLLAQCFAYCLMSSAACDPFRGASIRSIIRFGMFDYRSPHINDPAKARAVVVGYSDSQMTPRRGFRFARAA